MDRDRGAAEAVAALPSMKGVRLVLVGAGIEWEEAQAQVDDPVMEGRLHCIPKLPFDSLRRLTASADVGLSLDKGGHGNYEMSLPNKLFDFMHARLPMVVTARKEVAAIVRGHGLGGSHRGGHANCGECGSEAGAQQAKRSVERIPRDSKRELSLGRRRTSDGHGFGHLLEGPFQGKPNGVTASTHHGVRVRLTDHSSAYREAVKALDKPPG